MLGKYQGLDIVTHVNASSLANQAAWGSSTHKTPQNLEEPAAYVAGKFLRWYVLDPLLSVFSSIQKKIPSLPKVDAAPLSRYNNNPETSLGKIDIPLSSKEAEELIRKKIKLDNKKLAKKKKNKIVNKVVAKIMEARKEGENVQNNIDIFLKYNPRGTIKLYTGRRAYRQLGAATYRSDTNTMHLSYCSVLSKLEMYSLLVHEFGHAADDTRNKALQGNPSRLEREALAYHDRDKAGIFKQAVSKCDQNIRQASKEVANCVVKKQGCNSKNVKLVSEDYDRKNPKLFNAQYAQHIYSKDPRFKTIPFGRTLSMPVLGEVKVYRENGQLIIQPIEKMANFIVGSDLYSEKVKKLLGRPERVKITENVRYVDERFNPKIKKALCKELYDLEVAENEEFAHQLSVKRQRDERQKHIEL